VKGLEHLRELRSGPAIFISNHVTFVDHALILSALPARFRHRIAIAMEGEILQNWRRPPERTHWFTRLRWFTGYVLAVSLFNVFPLPKKSGFRRSFAFAGESMDRGYNVLVFPEGARTEDGLLHPFKAGIGLMVADLRAPVVPISINGLFELKRQRKYSARAGEVSVKIGEPVSFAQDADPEHITSELETRVASLTS
jgi:long-chain acyl-CoA synthetase